MSELNCDEFAELVTAFLDGALDRATEDRFLEHRARCPGCDRYLGQFRETIHCLGELPPETLSADARAQLLAAFRDWRSQ
ncbi:MAG: anti-sigma factor family protein [Pseudonocardiales bacterium]